MPLPEQPDAPDADIDDVLEEFDDDRPEEEAEDAAETFETLSVRDQAIAEMPAENRSTNAQLLRLPGIRDIRATKYVRESPRRAEY